MRIATIVILALALFGCRDKNNRKNAQVPKQAIQANVNSKGIQIDNSAPVNPDDTIPNVSIPAGAIQVTDNEIDSTSNIRIVGNGEDIILTPDWAKFKWKTITFSNYLHETKVKLKREPYGEGTEGVGHMGLFISSIDKDARFLVSGLNSTNRPVDTICIKRTVLYPGQKEKIEFKGITYTLYATGHKMDSVEKGYHNYKLFLTANVKGHIFNQLIASMKENFGDTDDSEVLSYFIIYYIGDIDGDNIPDFCMEERGNFWSVDIYYLSSIAGDKAIVKKIPSFKPY